MVRRIEGELPDGLGGDELVGRTVVPVLPHAMFGIPVVRCAIDPCILRDGRMETRLEHADERRRRQEFSEHPDGGQIRRIVCRREVAVRFHRLQHIVSKQHRTVLLSCLDRLEPHTVDLLQRRQQAVCGVLEEGQRMLDGIAMGGHRTRPHCSTCRSSTQ